MGALDTTLDTTLTGFTRFGFTARKLSSTEPFPGVEGHHIMVTGATGGIGRATALRLARNNAHVHAVGRNERKLAELVERSPGTIEPWVADLSSMKAIRDLADRFSGKHDTLDGLVNNVGVMSDRRTVTVEGFELTYATNLLGQYLLTSRLVPHLEVSDDPRVVMVSSGGMYSQGLTVGNMQSVRGEFNGTAAYARTKRGQVVLTEEWAPEFTRAGIAVNSMHPGWVDTAGVQTNLPTFRKITRPVLRDEAQGADTIVWLIGSPDARGETGRFWHDRVARPTHRSDRTRVAPEKRQRFVEMLASDAAPWNE